MERSRSHTSSIMLRNPTHMIACTEETSDNRETSCQKKTKKNPRLDESLPRGRANALRQEANYRLISHCNGKMGDLQR